MYFPANEVIPVTLVVYRSVKDTLCKQYTKTIDSLTKTITDIPYMANQFNLPSEANHPMVGTFRGANTDAPLDSFDIKIIDTTSIAWGPPQYTDVFVFDNFPKGCHAYELSGDAYYGGKTFINLFPYVQGLKFPNLTNNFPTYTVHHYGLNCIANYDRGKITINYTYDRQIENAYLTNTWPTTGILDTISKTYIGYRIK